MKRFFILLSTIVFCLITSMFGGIGCGDNSGAIQPEKQISILEPVPGVSFYPEQPIVVLGSVLEKGMPVSGGFVQIFVKRFFSDGTVELQKFRKDGSGKEYILLNLPLSQFGVFQIDIVVGEIGDYSVMVTDSQRGILGLSGFSVVE